jgi:hypothetical protein
MYSINPGMLFQSEVSKVEVERSDARRHVEC